MYSFIDMQFVCLIKCIMYTIRYILLVHFFSIYCRSSLMTGGYGSGPAVNPWLVNEPEETRGLGFGEIKQQQQQIIEGTLHMRSVLQLMWCLTLLLTDSYLATSLCCPDNHLSSDEIRHFEKPFLNLCPIMRPATHLRIATGRSFEKNQEQFCPPKLYF